MRRRRRGAHSGLQLALAQQRRLVEVEPIRVAKQLLLLLEERPPAALRAAPKPAPERVAEKLRRARHARPPRRARQRGRRQALGAARTGQPSQRLQLERHRRCNYGRGASPATHSRKLNTMSSASSGSSCKANSQPAALSGEPSISGLASPMALLCRLWGFGLPAKAISIQAGPCSRLTIRYGI